MFAIYYCRKKSRAHLDVQDIHQQQQENALTSIHFPRDISSPDLQLYKSGNVSPRSPRSPRPKRASPMLQSPGDRSPGTSPRKNKNILPNLADMKKTLNKGMNINFSVPKFSLQSVTLPKQLGGRGKENTTGDKKSESSVERSKLGDRKLGQFRERKISQDDSTVGRCSDSFDENLHVAEDNIVLINSCGIVASASNKAPNGDKTMVDHPEASTKVLVTQPSSDLDTQTSNDQDCLNLSQKNIDSSESSKNPSPELSQSTEDVFESSTEKQTKGGRSATAGNETKGSNLQLNSSRNAEVTPLMPSVKVLKVMNPEVKSRKLQRIIETMAKEIEQRVKDKVCETSIIFV